MRVSPAALGFAVFLPFLVITLCVPVHVQVVSERAPSAEILGTQEALGDGLRGIPATLQIEVEVISNGLMSLGVPALAPGQPIPSEQLDFDGEIGFWSHGPDRIESSTVGSTLSFAVTTDSVDLPFASMPGGGLVDVRVNGVLAAQIDLDSLEGGWTVVRVESGRTSSNDSFRWWHWHDNVEVGIPRDSEIQSATAYLGSLPLTTEVSSVDNETASVSLSKVQSVVVVLDGMKDAVWILFISVLFLLFFFAIGTGLEVSLGVNRPLLMPWTSRTLGGLGVTSLSLGVLNYVLPVRVAVFVVGGMVIALCVTALRRPRPLIAPPPVALSVGLAATISTLVGLITFNAGWMTGYLQTDVTDYYNLIPLLWNQAALDAGTDFGSGLRLVDFSIRSFLYGVSPLNAVSTPIASLAIGVVLAVAGGAEFASSRGYAPLSKFVVTAVPVLAGSATALWTEGYVSRHAFAMLFVPATLLAIAALADYRLYPRSWIIIGLAVALPMAIVPTFALTAGTVVLVLAARRLILGSRRIGANAWRGLSIFLITISVTVLPNLFWLRKFDTVESYAVNTSEIGRFVVVPFHDTLRFPASLLGLIPFHANGGSLLGREPDGAAIWPLSTVRDFLDSPPKLLWSIGVLSLFMMAVTVWLLVMGRRIRSVRLVLIPVAVTVLLYVIGNFVLLESWPAQAYTLLMYHLTLAPLILTLIIVSMAEGLRKTYRPTVRALLWMPLVAVIFMNASSTILDVNRLFEHPNGDTRDRWNLTVRADANRLADYVGSDAFSVTNFTLVAPYGALTVNDRGRVLGNIDVLLLEEAGAICRNCTRDPRNHSLLLPSDLEPVSAGDAQLVIGVSVCDGHPLVKGDRFALCRK